MTTTRISAVRQIDSAGDGVSVFPDTASWIGLAASPTFAAMALWNGLSPSGSDMLCINGAGGLPLNGMTAMYVLMTIFHARPWLSIASRLIHRALHAIDWASIQSIRSGDVQ